MTSNRGFDAIMVRKKTIPKENRRNMKGQKRKNIFKRPTLYGVLVGSTLLMSFLVLNVVHPVYAKGEGGEVLYLPLERSVDHKLQDLSEFQNHGTDHNTAPAEGPPQVGGKARFFSSYPYRRGGSQAPDWIDLGDDESLRLDNTDFTIAFWLNFAGYAWGPPCYEGDGNQACIFVSKGKSNGNDLYDMVWVGIKREVNKNKVQLRFNGPHYESSACTIEFYTWAHIAITFDRSTAQAKFYKNGIHVDTQDMGGVPSFEDWSGAELGRWDKYGRYWTGRLDEVRVYKRQLSVADVFRLWGLFSKPFYGYFNVKDYPSSSWGKTVDDIKDDIDAVAFFTNLIYVLWYLKNTNKDEANYNPAYVQYIVEKTNLTMFVGLPHYPESKVLAVIKLFDPDRTYGDRILAYYLDEPGCPTRSDHLGKRFTFDNLTKWCNDVHTASKAYYGYEIKTMVLFSSLWDYNEQDPSYDVYLNRIPEGVDIVCIEPYQYPDPKPPEKTYREYVAYINEMLRKPDLDGPWQTSVSEAYDWVTNVTTKIGMPRPVIMLGQAHDRTSIGKLKQMLYRRNYKCYVELALMDPHTIGILWDGYLRSRYYNDIWIVHQDIFYNLF
ncbi:MAG: LamG domain-containing protein [Candidatus Heimdallarchaeota archaeon]